MTEAMTAATAAKPAAQPAALPPRLADHERIRLERLEADIKGNLALFRQVGMALLEIKEGRLYRESHASFPAYLRERWGFSRQHAEHLISATAVAGELAGPVLPTRETQVRPLRLLSSPEERQAAWNDATSRAGGRMPTQQGVEESVAAVLARVRAGMRITAADAAVAEEQATIALATRLDAEEVAAARGVCLAKMRGILAKVLKKWRQWGKGGEAVVAALEMAFAEAGKVAA
jgi:hypothetical protein